MGSWNDIHLFPLCLITENSLNFFEKSFNMDILIYQRYTKKLPRHFLNLKKNKNEFYTKQEILQQVTTTFINNSRIEKKVQKYSVIYKSGHCVTIYAVNT